MILVFRNVGQYHSVALAEVVRTTDTRAYCIEVLSYTQGYEGALEGKRSVRGTFTELQHIVKYGATQGDFNAAVSLIANAEETVTEHKTAIMYTLLNLVQEIKAL